jgi:hypothetical protein
MNEQITNEHEQVRNEQISEWKMSKEISPWTHGWMKSQWLNK